MINGRRAMLGDKVCAGDSVTLHGSIVEPLTAAQYVWVMLNKPVGVVCTAARADKRNIVDFVGHAARIVPVGRLDKDSQGLILLTNHCDMVNRILCADNHHEKEYRVSVNKVVTDEFIDAMCRGIPVLGVITRPCDAFRESQYVFRITLVQGLNRQIRRMCKHLGYTVIKLERLRIMNIKLGDLPAGQWRELTDDERAGLLPPCDALPHHGSEQ